MTITIAKDFSRLPGHRSAEDGEHSGEQFLSEVLKPAYEKAFQENDTLCVNLDGAAGYSTSFLEAAFGGLARIYPIEEVQKRVKLISLIEPYLVDEIMLYIAEAREDRATFV